MRKRANETEKALAGLAIATVLGALSDTVWSADPGLGGVAAPPATENAGPAPLRVRALVVGGLRRGLVMQITPGHAEIVNAPPGEVTPMATAIKAGAAPEGCPP